MSVYVDDMRLPATVGAVRARWSHLLADSSVELRAFARRLGLNPAWIQYPGTPKEHFDVTDTVRAHALRLGAVPIRYGTAGALLLAAKAAPDTNPARAATLWARFHAEVAAQQAEGQPAALFDLPG